MGGNFILPLLETNDAHLGIRAVFQDPTTPIAEPASSDDPHLMFCPTLEFDQCNLLPVGTLNV